MITDWKKHYASKLVSPGEAASRIKNGDRVYLGSMCAEPTHIIQSLAESSLEDVELIQLKGGGEASVLVAERGTRFRLKTFSQTGRKVADIDTPEAFYVPLFHSEIPRFFKNRRIPIDVAVVQVSEPDRFGQASLGISVDITRAAVESARTVIAQVNPRMPRTLGNTFVSLDSIDYLVSGEEDLPEIQEINFTKEDKEICRFCTELIEDGSVLQVGFAAFSRGFAEHLMDHKDLGVHTEMFTDSLIDLVEAGVVTNATKEAYRGKSIATFCMGTKRLYEYVDNNPMFEFHPADTVLNPAFIGSNERMVVVNIALQVDLRGQIRQGSLGWTPFEGSGGEQDFMRGAGLSKGGRSVVCIRSTDPSGRSTIVPSFGPGSAVIMNRGDVHYVITEYGSAYLGGKTIRQRTLALIEVAHPDHKEHLMEQARELGYVQSNEYYCPTISPDFRSRIRSDRVFKGGLKGHVRSIKSTDEAMLRDLFYHLSEGSVYFRYFSPRRSMPHNNLRKYVNLSKDEGLSLVVTVGPRETRRMIAECRYVFEGDDPFPDFAIMVDENYHGRGIGGFLIDYIIELAKEQGIPGFRADVLISNSPMLGAFERLPYVLHRSVQDGVISIRFRFDELRTEQEAVD
jgi:acyl-CoA hydrolase/GNAT superfamily N-acetyltransferase